MLSGIRSRAVGYAKKNLRDVKDMALQFGFSKTQEARFPRHDLGAEQTGMNYLIIKSGQREAFAHRHRTAEEIYVVLSGSGRVKLDEELVELAPLDAVRVSPGVTRSFEAGPDGLQVLIFGPHVEGDGEMVPHFWGEKRPASRAYAPTRTGLAAGAPFPVARRGDGLDPLARDDRDGRPASAIPCRRLAIEMRELGCEGSVTWACGASEGRG
jgi:mannose-6-phosphate isomerase-like protein (cupin superfamily)